MFYKPGVSKDDGCSANAHDMEGGSFRVISILDYEVDNFSDVASIIEGSIYIVDRDGSREALGVQILGSDIIDINELAGGPESMRAFISSGVLLPMVWICRGSSVPLHRVVERTRMGVGSED